MSNFDWKDFLDIAEEIYQNQELTNSCYNTYEEACFRLIISRSYYAIFKQIEDYLQNRDVQYRGQNGGSHISLIRYVRQYNEDFSVKLERLKNLRVISDYKRNIKVVYNDVRTAMSLANSLNDTWPSVKDAIERLD